MHLVTQNLAKDPTEGHCEHEAAAGEQPSEQKQSRESGTGEVQTRLRSFLKQSRQYDFRLVLARLRGSLLWQEQVILHNKVCHSFTAPWHRLEPNNTPS